MDDEQNIISKDDFIKKSLDLTFSDYFEKDIEKDGNCYYRCLSYFFRKSEEFHREFRNLIYELFLENKNDFYDFLPDPGILGKKDPETEEEKIQILDEYGNNIRKDKFYAGDHELILTANYLLININVLYKDLMLYKSLNFYESPIKTEETMNILFINGNHYKLLYERNNDKIEDSFKSNKDNEILKEEKQNIKLYIKTKKEQINKNKKKISKLIFQEKLNL